MSINFMFAMALLLLAVTVALLVIKDHVTRESKAGYETVEEETEEETDNEENEEQIYE